MPTRASRAVVVVAGARAGGDRRRRGRATARGGGEENQRARDRVAIDDAGAWRVYDVHVSVDDDLGEGFLGRRRPRCSRRCRRFWARSAAGGGGDGVQ